MRRVAAAEHVSDSWILVVEDDANARTGLLQLLAGAGYAARGARNGQEALDLIESRPRPSLILLDLTLPLGTGWDLLKYVHDDAELRLVPTIVMTGSTQQTGLMADEVFGKPLDFPRLLRSISRIFERQRRT
jgi:CheY-like chemotaxis protein